MTTDDTTRPGPALDAPAAPEPGAPVHTQPLPAPPAPAAGPAPTRSPGVRMRTLVLGLVLLAVAATTGLRLLTDVDVDNGVVALAVLLAAGVLLLGGGVLGAAREARHDQN
jgi:hypothetical protein